MKSLFLFLAFCLSSIAQTTTIFVDKPSLITITVTPTNVVVAPPVTNTPPASGSQYFVSTTGVQSNTGKTIASPWPMKYALATVPSGSVLNFLPGTYPSIVLERPGLTLRSQVWLGAKVRGSPGSHGISSVAAANKLVIDGFEIDHSYIDGVKLRGDDSSVRNSWIHHSGQGSPNWKTNSNLSFSGQGIAAHGPKRTLVEFCMIEDGGAYVDHDHAFYGDGEGIVIRGNVFRRNLSRTVVLFDEDGPRDCAGSQVYCNLLVSNSGTTKASVVVVTYHGQTNFVFNNIIIHPTYYAVSAGTVGNGFIDLKNNIILGALGGLDTGYNGAGYRSDYNLSMGPLNFPGSHNVIGNPFFVNPSKWLYWLQDGSPARGKANKDVFPQVDFFRRAQTAVSDIGPFQFDPALAADTRNLSGAQGTNFWTWP